VRDLALDLSTGDLLLTNHAARLTTPTGGENVAQRLRIRLGLWQGDYILDGSVGIPYLRLLGVKNAKARLSRTLARAASSCPGIAALDSFALDVDANRDASVSLRGRTLTGEPVSLDAFNAGGVA
jgi:hypothetical protein